jgi:hypothetical protein
LQLGELSNLLVGVSLLQLEDAAVGHSSSGGLRFLEVRFSLDLLPVDPVRAAVPCLMIPRKLAWSLLAFSYTRFPILMALVRFLLAQRTQSLCAVDIFVRGATATGHASFPRTSGFIVAPHGVDPACTDFWVRVGQIPEVVIAAI